MDIPDTFFDIEPIYMNEADDAVCKITYPADAAVAFNYLRAIIQLKEYSNRALQLTAICLGWNPSNYTTWHFRRRCIAALDYDTITELKFVEGIAGSNPKNYQIWYHRRALIELKQDMLLDKNSKVLENELMYIESVLKVDTKNYHAWSNRKWIIETYFNISLRRDNETLSMGDSLKKLLQIWNNELGYTKTMILADTRNNSAWNYRWFIVHKGYDIDDKCNAMNLEIEYAFNIISLDPFNESPWQYFLGYAFENKLNNDLILEMENKIKHLQRTDDKELSAIYAKCPQIMAAHVELLMLNKKDPEASLKNAQSICDELSTKYDTIRAKYWLFRSNECAMLRK